MFTREEAAVAYALAAKRLLGDDNLFLESHPALVPVFVTHLFQSLEISIKHVGIQSGLFTESEARSRKNGSGHGIKELADLAVERLGGEPYDPLVQALTCFQTDANPSSIVRLMVRGPEFERTRNSYAHRRLGYGEVKEGDFAVVDRLDNWVTAVKDTALNLPRIVSVVTQWKSSTGNSGPFAIWYESARGDD